MIDKKCTISVLLMAASPPIYLHLIFDILQLKISSLKNWIFADYTGNKNPVQTRKKIQSYRRYAFLPKRQLHISVYLTNYNWLVTSDALNFVVNTALYYY